MKEAEANEQHKSIIGALTAAALTWVFEQTQINLVVGNHAYVVESDFYIKRQKLDIQKRKKNRLSTDNGHRYAKRTLR